MLKEHKNSLKIKCKKNSILKNSEIIFKKDPVERPESYFTTKSLDKIFNINRNDFKGRSVY